MSTHTITATLHGSNDHEDWDVEYEITYRYTPGRSGGFYEPGHGPSVEFISARWKDGTDPLTPEEIEWCQEWLYEDEAAICRVAEERRAADADDYADFKRRERIDAKLTGGDR